MRGEKRTPKKVDKSGSIAGLLKRGWTLIRAYPYQDETGALLYENVRLEITVAGKRSKTFRQRRPRESAGYVENLDGVRRVPYRLKEFLDAPGQEIHVPEGEKDADRLAAMGL